MSHEEARAALRARHQVRLVSDAEIGFGLDKLPNGVYGFTYAPGQKDAPLFPTGQADTFELHKLADGAAEMLGFVTAKEAGRLDQAGKFNVFPRPTEAAATLVSVPLSRLSRHREHSMREPTGFEVQLGPLHEA